jgi:hypothetical protein
MDRKCLYFNSNYKKGITPTNPMRENEYEDYVVSKLNETIRPIAQLELDGITVVFRFAWNVGMFTLRIALWDENDNEIESLVDNKYIPAITGRVNQIIDAVNGANIEFVSFESDNEFNNYFQIYKGHIYGLIYDLDKDEYVEPAKIVKTPLKLTLKENMSLADILKR